MPRVATVATKHFGPWTITIWKGYMTKFDTNLYTVLVSGPEFVNQRIGANTEEHARWVANTWWRMLKEGRTDLRQMALEITSVPLQT